MKTLLFVLPFGILLGCQTMSVKKENTGISCELAKPIKSADAAAVSKVVCKNEAKQFEAVCDFTVDAAEFKQGYFIPEKMSWVKAGANEGVEFQGVDEIAGFIVCEKL